MCSPATTTGDPMARRRIEFRPDPQSGSWVSKLYVTASQRRRLLKWTLYTLFFLAVLVLQDVIFSRIHLLAGRMDLVPMTLLLICVLEGVESGSVFVLLCSAVYLFSGSAPGTYVIALMTVAGFLGSWLRQSYLRKSLSAAWVCSAIAMLIYELSLFALGMLLGRTHMGRLYIFIGTTIWSVLTVPALHPVLQAIGTIGGESWKE